MKEVFVFLKALAAESVDALAPLVCGRNQMSALEYVQMPRCERLAQDEAIREIKHAETAFPAKLLQDGQTVHIRHGLQEELEVVHGLGLLKRENRWDVFLDPFARVAPGFLSRSC